MAKLRSPNYPTMSFWEAFKIGETVFKKDHRNKVSRAALGAHLGYKSLSGPALAKIAALRHYGVIEGSGDELKISEDFVTAMMAPKSSAAQEGAVTRMATRPALFQDIAKEFATPPSQENLQFWLVKRQFTPDAAKKAAASYLDTVRLAGGNPQDYDANDDEAESSENPPVNPQGQTPPKGMPPPVPPKPGTERAEFPLPEGVVRLEFPASLSTASYEDMEAWMELVLRRAKRSVKKDEADN